MKNIVCLEKLCIFIYFILYIFGENDEYLGGTVKRR